MDGRIKVFQLSDLKETSLSEKFFVEIPYGVQCTDYVALDGGA
jgi:hypothetical protein